jgi:hypothetical protein
MRCCSCLLVLLLVAGAFGAGFVLRGGAPPGPLLATLLAEARQRVTGVAAPPTSVPAPSGSSAPVIQRSGNDVTVRIDEAALTQQANAVLSGQPLGDTPLGPAVARSLSIHLQNGQIVADGTAQVGPATTSANFTATPRAEGGRLQIAVTDAKVGGVSLPAAMRQQAEGALQALVDQLMAQQGIQVRTVTVGDGTLVATGTAA